jgi:hypothetical protein
MSAASGFMSDAKPAPFTGGGGGGGSISQKQTLRARNNAKMLAACLNLSEAPHHTLRIEAAPVRIEPMTTESSSSTPPPPPPPPPPLTPPPAPNEPTARFHWHDHTDSLVLASEAVNAQNSSHDMPHFLSKMQLCRRDDVEIVRTVAYEHVRPVGHREDDDDDDDGDEAPPPGATTAPTKTTPRHHVCMADYFWETLVTHMASIKAHDMTVGDSTASTNLYQRYSDTYFEWAHEFGTVLGEIALRRQRRLQQQRPHAPTDTPFGCSPGGLVAWEAANTRNMLECGTLSLQRYSQFAAATVGGGSGGGDMPTEQGDAQMVARKTEIAKAIGKEFYFLKEEFRQEQQYDPYNRLMERFQWRVFCQSLRYWICALTQLRRAFQLQARPDIDSGDRVSVYDASAREEHRLALSIVCALNKQQPTSYESVMQYICSYVARQTSLARWNAVFGREASVRTHVLQTALHPLLGLEFFRLDAML